MKIIIILTLLILINCKVFCEQKIKDFYFSNYKKDGTKDLEINGTEAIVRDKYVDINEMEAKYYSNDTLMQVKSDKAKVNRESFDALLENNIEVKIPIEKGKDYTTVTCDGTLEMEYNEGIAIFNNNVVVENPNGKLFCDRAKVYFDTVNKKLIKIVAEGNVKIVQDENTTFAEKATYIEDEKRLVLEGRPHLIYFPKEKKSKKE